MFYIMMTVLFMVFVVGYMFFSVASEREGTPNTSQLDPASGNDTKKDAA